MSIDKKLSKSKSSNKKKPKLGRPKGSGIFGENTKSMSIPLSLIPEVINLLEEFCEDNAVGDKAVNYIKDLKKRFDC